MPSPPLWLALLGSGIAALAAVMAVAQWRTAHQKVVLDLFDRRFAIYDQTKALVGRILLAGSVPLKDLVELQNLRERAQFLFGADVLQFFDKLVQSCGALEKANLDLNIDTPDRTEAAQQRDKAFWALRMQFSELSPLAAGYMKMDQKREWFSMNYRRGRLWVVLTVLWVGAIGWTIGPGLFKEYKGQAAIKAKNTGEQGPWLEYQAQAVFEPSGSPG